MANCPHCGKPCANAEKVSKARPKAKATAEADLAKRQEALKKEIAELRERQRYEQLAELTNEADLRKEYMKRARGEK
jgi:hypothetical protein